MNLKVGHRVRINTPGESHHERVGTVIHAPLPDTFGRIIVDLGDVRWMYFEDELVDLSTED